jgi:putative molybdopterin biosynthesis protein
MVKRYLSLCSLEEALHILKTSFEPPERTETIPVTQSLGRMLAAPVHAKYSVPESNLAAMDGIAVRSSETLHASDQTPVMLSRFARVNTGNIVPPEFDAVIMIEDTWQDGERFLVRKAAAPRQHIRMAGEDIRANRLILPRGHQVRAFDIGALATYGIVTLDVHTVQVGIIPTGSELVPLGVRPAPGQVVESNTIMAQVFLDSMGAHCSRSPIVRDNPGEIKQALLSAVKTSDLVLISAGSSAGTRDFTANVIATLGEILFHGVAVKPGKPVMAGNIGGKPVIGLPGYPLAAQTVLREFAAPLLEWWGLAPPQRHAIRAKLSTALSSDPGFDEFVPVSVGRIGTDCWGIAHSRGSGIQMATVKANSYVHIPAQVEGYEAGHELEMFLTTDPGSIERTILLSGTVEPALEELGAIAHRQGMFLHAENTGNMGAILMLRRGSCHAAAIFMPVLPPQSRHRFIVPHLASMDLAFVHIATLQLGIASRDDVTPEKLASKQCINTRKDSPERMIFDALLESQGIDPSRIAGYEHEVANSPAVAAAVLNGSAEAGICSYGAAHARGLRFIPVAQEQYELAFCREMLEDPRVCSLISMINTLEYRQVLDRIGIYDTTRTGTIRFSATDNPEPGIALDRKSPLIN